jgi:flagellar FliL protein
MATSTPTLPGDTNATPAKKSKSGLLLALLALVITAGGAAGAYYYFFVLNSPKAPVVEAPIAPIFVALEPFTVNLLPGNRSRFLHVALTLKVGDAKSQALLAQYLPEVRSRVLTELSNRTGDSLVAPADKAKLASDIMAALNQPFATNLPPPKVASVMYTTFMLQ